MLNRSGCWLVSLVVLQSIFSILGTTTTSKAQLSKIDYSWIYPNIAYPSTAEKTQAEKNGSYVPFKVVNLDADSYLDLATGKIRYWVTTPWFQDGIPYTLYEIRDNKQKEPLMYPFPSWKAQDPNSCDGPKSVYRIYVDQSCGIMWVADSGWVNSFVNPSSACPPKLLAYDLKNNDKLLLRYVFSDTDVYPNTILNTIVVTSCRGCSKSLVCIADVNGYGLIFFDWASNKSWRVYNPYCYPNPNQGYQTINGTTFTLMDGVFGIAFSPLCDQKQRLYFHSFASLQESWVNVSSLRDPNIVTDSVGTRNYFYHSGDIRAGQSTVEVITYDGILLYSVLPLDGIGCWNTAEPLTKENQHVIYRDNVNLQFISGMKLKNNKTLLLASCKLQNYINTLKSSPNVTNYRIIEIDIDALLNGTPCRKKNSHG